MKTIIIDVPRSCNYGREIHQGVYEYARPDRPWLFDSLLSRGGRKWLRDSNTVGLISSQQPNDYMAAARRFGLTAVGVGKWFPGADFSGLPYVDVDPLAIGEMAAEYFVERGFRNFAMFNWDQVGFPNTFLPCYRGEAFVAALQRRGLDCNVFDPKKRYPSCGEPVPAIIGGDERIRRWLGGLSKPLAVLAANDSLGQWICGVCWGAGFRVPEEIAVLGVNDDMYCRRAHPPLSTIAVPAEQVGYEAARLLDELLHKRGGPKCPILLPPVGVITRQSTDVMAVDDRYVAEAVRYIRENACGDICVSDVAAWVSLPRRSLERRFQKVLGRSPFAEIKRVRIKRVKILLAQTGKTLEVIAPECGFSGITRMSPAFKKATGKTPGAWRKQFRNQ